MGKGPSQRVVVMTFAERGPEASHRFLFQRSGNYKLSKEHYALSIKVKVSQNGEQYSKSDKQEDKIESRTVAKSISIVDYCLCYGLEPQLAFLKATDEFASELTRTDYVGLRYAIANKHNQALTIALNALKEIYTQPAIGQLITEQRPKQGSLLLDTLKSGNTDALMLLLKELEPTEIRQLFIQEDFFHHLLTHANEDTFNQVYELFLSNNKSLSINNEDISTLLAINNFTAYVTVASRQHDSQKPVLNKIDALKSTWNSSEVFKALSSCHQHKKTTHIGRVFDRFEEKASEAIKGMQPKEKTLVFKWLSATDKKADKATLKQRLGLPESVAKKMPFFSKGKPVEKTSASSAPTLVN